MAESPQSPDIFLNARSVRQRYGNISDMSLWRWLKDADLRFPKPIRINKRRLWRLAELQQWDAERSGNTRTT